MSDYVINLKFQELEKKVDAIAGILSKMENSLSREVDLWDGSEIIRRWNVSERTLATWRKDNRIGYVKIGGKIYYTSEDRAKFLNNNHVRGS